MIPAERPAKCREERTAQHPDRVRANLEQFRRRETTRQREERLCRENLEAWCDHHLRQEATHEDLARQHRQEYQQKLARLRAMEGATAGGG